MVPPGEFFCILGESGCGKTTLLKLIAGLDQCTSGRVLLSNEVVRGPHYSRCLVFQKPSLFPWLTVRRNIRLGLDIRGNVATKEELVSEAIDLVGLDGFGDYLPSQISGGMAQRVVLARALINRPEVLLLDEPFGALDAVTRERMQEELLRIWRERTCTTIFVTHDIDEAIRLGTHVVLISPRPGRITRVLEVSLSHPRVRTSREFLAFRGSLGSFSTLSGPASVSMTQGMDEPNL